MREKDRWEERKKERSRGTQRKGLEILKFSKEMINNVTVYRKRRQLF